MDLVISMILPSRANIISPPLTLISQELSSASVETSPGANTFGTESGLQPEGWWI
jgi:hypothetical protein